MAKQIAENTQMDTSVRESLKTTTPSNAALSRLRGRVVASADASATITSYDRMHHRHNRS